MPVLELLTRGLWLIPNQKQMYDIGHSNGSSPQRLKGKIIINLWYPIKKLARIYFDIPINDNFKQRLKNMKRFMSDPCS
jgi:hypothetical protein